MAVVKPSPFRKHLLPRLNVPQEPAHKFSSTQFDLADVDFSRVDGSPLPKIEALKQQIAEEDLAEDGKEGNPHITVKYGLHTEDPDEVREAVREWLSSERRLPSAKLGAITLFPSKENAPFDVVKIDVDSPGLESLNAFLSDRLPHTDTHPVYHPHLTLAYVKPGMGNKYVGEGLGGHEVLLRKLVFSSRNGRRTVIDLSDESRLLYSGKRQKALSPTLIEIPDVRQEDDYSCGAAAAMAVGKHWNTGPDSLAEWKRELGTDVEESTRPGAIVGYLTALGLQVEAQQDMGLEGLRASWSRGWPVVCPIQEYGVPDKKASFAYGHYVVAIGEVPEGAGYIVVQDPSADNVLTGEDSDAAPGKMLIRLSDWLEAWHDKDADGNEYIQYGIAVGPPVTGADLVEAVLSHRGEKDLSYLSETSGGALVPPARQKKRPKSLLSDPEGLKRLRQRYQRKGLFSTIEQAGRWLAAKWEALEARYGRPAALGMAVAMLGTSPVPGNIAAVIAAAEAIRGLHGFFKKELGGEIKELRGEKPKSPQAKESYFATCERDEEGHCLPGNRSGGGTAKKPSKTGKAPSKPSGKPKPSVKEPVAAQAAEDVAAFRPSKPNERKKVEPPREPTREPPWPTGTGSGKGFGYTATGDTNTKIGDKVEAAAEKLGFRNILPEGQRHGRSVAKEGSTLDREYDHSGWAFEVKCCTTAAKEYKAKPKKEEMEGKRRFAEMHGLKPATMIAVLDAEKGEVHYYWREGIGAYSLTPTNISLWNYAGSVTL